MANKFLIIIFSIIAVMAALVFMPGIRSEPSELQQDLGIEYGRQNLTRLEDGRYVAASAEDLVIRNNRYATYRNLTHGLKTEQFTISGEELNGLKGLVISTGFMQVRGEDYPHSEGHANVTRYTLKLNSGGSSKTVTWFNLEASQVAVPAIVRNIGGQLDDIIERHT